jgi:hypothetical protein
LVKQLLRLTTEGLKTSEELLRDCNIFTHSAYKEQSWLDEAPTNPEYNSVDFWDMYVRESGMEEFMGLFLGDSGPTVNGVLSSGRSLVEEANLRYSITSFRDCEVKYSAQSMTSRIFAPSPFTASPSYNALGTP